MEPMNHTQKTSGVYRNHSDSYSSVQKPLPRIRTTIKLFVAFVYFIALAALTSTAQAATRNVPGTYATIQAAINASSNGDTVLLAPGTYTGTGNRDMSYNGKAITVTSSAGAATTIIDCQGSAANPHQAFKFNSGESSASVLRGVTIQNAYRAYTILGISGGGAIQIDTASPIINQCVFKNCVANSGGAIYTANGSPLITQCDFFNNFANITILNVNDYGGAIYVAQTILSSANVGIADCVFSGNQAASDGGAIGVGGLLSGLNVVIYNCSFYNNNAFGVGELISLSSQPGTLAFSGGNTTITNCILWNDASPAELSTALPLLIGSNVQYCDIRDAGYAGNNGNINADPKYVNAAAGNFHLGSGSPCINTGTTSGAPPVDHDGVAWSGGVSMGAFDATPATHFSVVASSTATAGSAITYTVTALTAGNATATTYSGTVHFTSTDPQAVLPADTTLTNGTGTFSATLKTAGSQTITATDTSNASITGTSNAITVSAAAATRYSLTVPVNATAGTAFSVTVRAVDAYGNTATSYAGTVHFTSSDPLAVLPANATLTNGTKTFSATLKTAGNQTITATDTVTSSITGTSGAINVTSGTATKFTVTAASTATAGTPINVTVTALDAFNNTATTYAGTIHFTSNDPAAALPADATLTNGTGTFSATLKTVGNRTISVKDTVTTATGTSGTIVVSAGAATSFTVTTPSTATAGTAIGVSLKAVDAYGNKVTNYTGTVHFTSSDPAAVLPANATLTAGLGSFSATLKTAGTQTITATDTVTASTTGSSGPIVVSGGPATRFTVTTSGTGVAGSPTTVTVTAVDQFGNPTTNYNGTVHFTSTDPQAGLPADVTLTNGTGTFTATLKTAGPQTITATDTTTPSITGTSTPVSVTAGPAADFTVTTSGTGVAGSPTTVTVAAVDAFGNPTTSYSGTVHFTSTDPQAGLPADATLTNGTGTFTATLKTAGTQTITATDTVNSSITGTSNPVTVTGGAAAGFTLTSSGTATAGSPTSITVTAVDAFGNPTTNYSGTVHFTSTDAQASLPANATLTNGTGSFSAVLKTAGTQTVTATDTVNSTIAGTTNPITVSGGIATHLSVTASGTATAGSATSVTVTALDAFGNTATGYSGTVHFTSTDAQASLPANAALTNGTGTFSATLKTAGSQTITATDTVTSSINGTTAPITVTGGAAAGFTLTSSGTATAGSPTSITVTAVDAFGNPTTNYSGTVHFTSTDAQASLPANAMLTNGTGSFSAVLKTAGPQTVTATDTVNSTIAGTTNPITVSGGTATQFSVTASGTATAGSATSVTVTALDAFGNTATGYSGTVHFTSTDPQASLPADGTLTNGTKTFSATLKTAGSQTITATDTVNSSITGTSNPVTVNGAAVAQLSVTAPSTTTAGAPLVVTVTAWDAFGNPSNTYSGTVHFTSTDPQAQLPADTTLTNGTGTFAATLKTGGTQTITAKDTVNSSLTGTTAPITVTSGAATHISVTTSGTGVAGSPVTVTVTTLDDFGNTVTGYTGPVHFSSTDAQAGLPADATLTNGTGTFTATLKTAGTQTITATDTTNSSITGTSAPITVTAGSATKYSVTAPASATAGTAVNVTVTALDAYGNTATGYSGQAHFTSTDSRAVLPNNPAITNGTGTFTAIFKSGGSQTITATDTVNSGITGTTGPIAVSPGPVVKFIVSAPATAIAGAATTVTVTAMDNFSNVVTAYAGTVKITSTDAAAVLPANSTLTNGTGTFSVTLKTVGSQTVTATDTVTPAVRGTSSAITVGSGPAVKYVLVLPSTGTAGVPVNVTVTALDLYNNVATSYAGLVHFTSYDPQAILPADTTLTNGTKSFSVTFLTAASIVLRARDTVDANITGIAPIVVSPNVMTHIGFDVPATAVSGSPFYAQVSGRDAYENTVPSYNGTVHFTSTDPQAVLPGDLNLPNGTRQVSFKLKTVGNQTISATDISNPSFTGTSATIAVMAAPARLTVTAPSTTAAGAPFTFTVTAADQSGNPVTGYSGTVHFTSTDPQAQLPADTAISGGTGTFTATLMTSGAQSITATDTTIPSVTGKSNTITVTSGSGQRFNISVPSTSTAGAAITATITAVDSFGNTLTGYTGTVHLTSSDPQAVLPADTTLTNGSKQVTVKLRTSGNQTITATDTANSSMTGTSSSVAVSPAAPMLVITAPSTATAGTSVTFTAAARDIYGNNVPSYSGTVHFTSTDPQATLPADTTLTNGTGTFTATLKTSGTQTITGTDTVNTAINGKSNNITVSASALTKFRVTIPATGTVNGAFIATVSAVDAFGNVITGYAGTAHFASTDPQAVLPANSTLTNGTKSFSIRLKTAGSQTITVNDVATPSITGTSNTITIS